MKRKNILAVATMLLAMSATAQTNFRHITYDEAINAAKAENKLVFMDFYTDWCGPCKMMMREVFPQKEVGDFMNEKFVCIKLNAEKEGKELAKLYKVKAYPTFIGIDTNKNIIFTKVGGSSADTFVAEIERKIDPNKSPEKMKERYEKGERTAELISAYAGYLTTESQMDKRDQKKIDLAYNIINEYFNNLNDSEKLSAENLFIYKYYTKNSNSSIAQYMITHRNEFAPEIKQTVEDIISNLMKSEIYSYLRGNTKYDEKDYLEIKKKINEIGLNADKSYDRVYKLIECHAKGDLNAYIEMCKKEYPALTKEQQNMLLIQYSQLINTTDKTIRKKAANFIRSFLSDMSATEILYAAYQLLELESEKHK